MNQPPRHRAPRIPPVAVAALCDRIYRTIERPGVALTVKQRLVHELNQELLAMKGKSLTDEGRRRCARSMENLQAQIDRLTEEAAA